MIKTIFEHMVGNYLAICAFASTIWIVDSLRDYITLSNLRSSK